MCAMKKGVDNNMLNLPVGLQALNFSEKFVEEYLVELVHLRNRRDYQQILFICTNAKCTGMRSQENHLPLWIWIIHLQHLACTYPEPYTKLMLSVDSASKPMLGKMFDGQLHLAPSDPWLWRLDRVVRQTFVPSRTSTLNRRTTST